MPLVNSHSAVSHCLVIIGIVVTCWLAVRWISEAASCQNLAEHRHGAGGRWLGGTRWVPGEEWSVPRYLIVASCCCCLCRI